jgi:hypothetical protein
MPLTEGLRIQSKNSATQTAVVDAAGLLSARLPTNADGEADLVGAVRAYSEVNQTSAGEDVLRSPEADDDWRWRLSRKIILDQERFRYADQNTGKHSYANLTMAADWTTSGLVTNSGSITTLNTGLVVSSYAFFPIMTPGMMVCEFDVAFSAQPNSNTNLLLGMFVRNTFASIANITPLDGVYFRISPTGLEGVVNRSGTETVVPFAFPPIYLNNATIHLKIAFNRYRVAFYVGDTLHAEATMTSTGSSPMFSSWSLPFGFQHTITTGAAGATLQATLLNYRITQNGLYLTRDSGEFGNAVRGSYQGLSGDTMGSAASYANSANPTAAVPTNTTALVTGLGGQVWETDTLAAGTDGIIIADQVPDASITQRRLVLAGVWINSYVQTALVNGGYVAQWSLAFGATALDMSTAESATAKAPRRIALGTQSVAANLVANSVLTRIYVKLTSPVYVNPGEYVGILKKKVGTAPDSGVVAHLITFDYTWE